MTDECADPLDLFRTEAYHDDIQVQIRAVKKLPTLAVALDVDRTRHELIPALEDYLDLIYFNNEEVLLVLADQLGKFIPFIGGPEFAFILFPMLKKLAAADDAKPREKAVESLQNIACLMSGDQLEEHFVKLIKSLSEAEWFTSKCSAAGLIAFCYPKFSEEGKSGMRRLFFTMMENDSPMVKREAAKYFPDFIKVIEMEYLKEECMASFNRLAKDDQDSVRLLTVNVAVALASRLTHSEIEEYILETLNGLCVDPSWRVRYQFANEINSIQTVVGPVITRKSIVPLYKNLVRDSEANIREISARNIVRFCELLQKSYQEQDVKTEDLDPIIKQEILPLIKELDKDVVEDVQNSLYSVIISLSSLLGEINTKDFLLPLITSSIENDSSRVKENIIANLNNIMCVIGIEDLTDTVQKLMTDLMKNTIWRTRRNLIVTLSHIARHSKQEYFDEHLKPLYVNLLNDTVYGVRKVAPLVLPVLVKHFGMTWARQNIIQTYLEFSQKTYYLLRMMCLFGIDELISPSLESKDSQTSYLEILKNRQGPICSKILNRIKNLNELLTVQLREEWVNIVLSYAEEESYFNDDIRAYAEDTIDAFNQCGNLEIIKITEEEIPKRDIEETYLEGLLFLVLAYFLDKIHSLAHDKVQNVRIRAANTLRKIYEFNTALGKELDENWVEDLVNQTSPDDRLNLGHGLRNELLDAVNQKNKFEKLSEFADVPMVVSPMEEDPPTLIKEEEKLEGGQTTLEAATTEEEQASKIELAHKQDANISETLDSSDGGIIV